MAKFVTIKDIPLMRVGTWDASTGESSVTREDLDNIVAAAQSDGLDVAPIKIGHTDPRFDNPEFDGDPVYGQVTNLRVTDDRDGTLWGDYINVPEELAESLPSAYPYRSIEVAWNVELRDAEGATVEEFPAVLVGVALLGKSAPAVSGLDKVAAAASHMAAGVRVGSTSSFSMAQFALPGGYTADQLRKVLQDMLYAEGGDDMFRWVMDWDDTMVIYEVDGRIYQSTYTIDGDGRAQLTGQPVEVVEKRTFQPVGNGTTPPSNNDTAAVPQPFRANNDSKHGKGPTGATTAERKEDAEMALSEKQLANLRNRLGLPADTTEADALAALEAVTDEQDGSDNTDQTGGGNPPAGNPDGGDQTDQNDQQEQGGNVRTLPNGQEAPAPPERQPMAARSGQSPTDEITVSREMFTALQSSHEQTEARLAAFEKRDADTRRDGLIQSALRDGRLHPKEKDAWRKALDDNEQLATDLLNNRAPVFPTNEIGSSTAPFSASISDATNEAVVAAENHLFNIGSTGGN